MVRVAGYLAGNTELELGRGVHRNANREGCDLFFFLFLGINALVYSIHGGLAQSASYVHVLINIARIFIDPETGCIRLVVLAAIHSFNVMLFGSAATSLRGTVETTKRTRARRASSNETLLFRLCSADSNLEAT